MVKKILLATAAVIGLSGAANAQQATPEQCRAYSATLQIRKENGITVPQATLDQETRLRHACVDMIYGTAQPYYPRQPAYAGNSAACQSWLAVLNDPRYDAATRAQAQQIVSGCGLPPSGSDTRSTAASGYPGDAECAAWRMVLEDRRGNPALLQSAFEIVSRCGRGPARAYAPAAAPTTGSTEIALISNGGGSYYINGTVNGAAVQFVLDTGADVTTIPLTFARQLARQGRLSKADIRGVTEFGMANGSAQRAPVITLQSVTIGGRIVYNVTAAITPVGSDPLLGQSFLRHFRSYTIDNRRNVLVLG